MPRLIALEWDHREARVAIASTAAGRAPLLEQAFTVAWTNSPEDPAAARAAFGEQLRAALAARRVKRSETSVALGRTSIELKMLNFPPAPDDELPDMVGFRAPREFSSTGADWPVDFLPIGANPAEPRTVLAATVAPELVAQIQEICSAAGLEVEHLILRPCASASLFLRRHGESAPPVCLLVDLLTEEADLTAIADGHVVFMRTARLPQEHRAAPDGSRLLAGEVRRTIAAIQHQLGGRRVEAVFLCGAPEVHRALAEGLARDTNLPCTLFDPLTGVDLSAELRMQPPGNVERFAPLVGMLLDAAEGSRRTIDFLDPRRRPAPQNHRRTQILAGAVAALFVLAVAAWFWNRLEGLDQEIARLTQEMAAQEPLVKAAEESVRVAKEIDSWRKHEVIWLDELDRFSRQFPPPADALLTQLRLSPHGDGGVIQLEGHVRDSVVIESLEESLRDARHRVEGKGRNQAPQSALAAKYPWQFRSQVIVAHSKGSPATPLSPAPARGEIAP